MTTPMNPWHTWVNNLTAAEMRDRLAYLESLPQPLDHTDSVVHLVLGSQQLLREIKNAV